jgi:hypothetical protein
VSYGGSYAYSRGGGGVLTCVHPNGAVTYEEPTADERALAMGFPWGFTAATGVAESTQRELLGQAMDLNSVMWILAVAREAGSRRVPLGGEVVRAGLSRKEGAQKGRPQAAGATGAQRGQSHAASAAEAQRGQSQAASAAGARKGQPQAVGAAEAQRGPSQAAGAAGAQRGQPQAASTAEAQRRRPQAAGVQRGQPQAAETGPRKGGAAGALREPQAVRRGPRAVAACVGPSASAAAVGQVAGASAQPLEAATVGGGPSGGGWKVGAQLTNDEGTYVSAVVERNRGVFAFSLEEIGKFKLFEVKLKLKSDQPIFERRRRHSVREWELVDERCRELEAAGIIEECDSDFAANSVMAAKKDPEGNWKLARFCTDLRRINEQTAQDRYPMPLPEEVLEGLGHAKFYSTIDIRGAFHQLVVKQEDRRKLAFWSSSKLYCWKRCPFGARNASATVVSEGYRPNAEGLGGVCPEFYGRLAGGRGRDRGEAHGAGPTGV